MSQIRIKQIQEITSTSPAAGDGLQYDTGTSKYVNGPVNAATVTITDNESTSETNAIIFTAGGALTGGNLGLESDGDLTYNPSTGTLNVTNIVVSGTTTTSNVETVTTSSGVIFEGSVSDANETLLKAGTVSQDNTLTLPDATDTLVGKATTDTFTNKTLSLAAISGHLLGDLTVDNVNIDSNIISSTTGNLLAIDSPMDIQLNPGTGYSVIIDGLINIDGSVVTGATSLLTIPNTPILVKFAL